MANPDRSATHDLTWQRLLEQRPYAFGFFQALRRLEGASPDKPRIGHASRLGDEVVRLGQAPSLAFAPAELESFQKGSGGRPRLLVRFFGLFGPNGPLPLHLTEYARDRERNSGDSTFSRFADLFHHRLLSLFYRAWSSAQPAVQFDRPRQDRFSFYVGSLIGVDRPDAEAGDVDPQRARLFMAGVIGNQSRSAEGLEALLSDFFRLPVKVETFVGHWVEIEPDTHCRLGGPAVSTMLGTAATLGTHVWDCQQKFRVVFGPLSGADHERLLPGSTSSERLVALVRQYTGDELTWDVRLVRRKEDVPTAGLGDTSKLAWNSWLEAPEHREDRGDVLFSPALARHRARDEAKRILPTDER